MRIKIKHPQSTLKLHDLLRKRKLTFSAWLSESGVSTYTELLRWCSMIGLTPPTQEEWDQLVPVQVTAPADGVVVIDNAPHPDPQPLVVVPPKKPNKGFQKKRDDDAPEKNADEFGGFPFVSPFTQKS